MKVFFARTALALGIVCLAGSAVAETLTAAAVNEAAFDPELASVEGVSPVVLKAQIMLDRANASPGVIDGIYGDNVAKAVSAFEEENGLPVDGMLDEAVWSALVGPEGTPVLIEYEITAEDVDYSFAESIPDDFAEKAQMDRLNYTSPEEMLSERFHMDEDLFRSLNPGLEFAAGTKVLVANVERPPIETKVARIEADKSRAQLRAYDEANKLLVAYPATIGSNETPSPSGTHEVTAIAEEPVYYYRPDKNFQQGDNTEPLDIPPGPNNPVGTVWIGLSEPSYGIHGTPEPSEIDKTSSHGCVRLTNWDAEQLVQLVEPGVTVEFLE